MKKLFIFAIFNALIAVAAAQEPAVRNDNKGSVNLNDEVFTVVETDPVFPGGQEGLAKYIQENIQYPIEAKEKSITGNVLVTFIVEKNGSVSNVKVLRDIGGGCGDEVVRIVKAMPRWKPGKQRGKPVRVQFNLPVNFSL